MRISNSFIHMYLYLLLLLLPPAFAGIGRPDDDETIKETHFDPVSYEDIYAPDRDVLRPSIRMRQCTIVDEASAKALHQEIAELGGAYELTRVEGHYVVISTGKPLEGQVSHGNHLDTPISFSVKNATVWEALKQFNLRLADSATNSAKPYILVEFGSPQRPAGIWSASSVNLDMQATPARQVLLEILAQSQLPLAYVYDYRASTIGGRPFDYAMISICIYNEWGDMSFFETDEGLLIPQASNYFYRGKIHEPVTSDGPGLSMYLEDQEANKAYYDEQERLMSLPPLPDE